MGPSRSFMIESLSSASSPIRAAAQKIKVLHEMKELGCATIAIVNHITPEAHAATDLLIKLSSPLPVSGAVSRICRVGTTLRQQCWIGKRIESG